MRLPRASFFKFCVPNPLGFQGWLQYCSFDSAVNLRDVLGVRGGDIRPNATYSLIQVSKQDKFTNYVIGVTFLALRKLS